MKKLFVLSCCFAVALCAAANQADAVGASPGPGIRYATDAYPGFDTEKSVLSPERKELQWYHFFSHPKMDDATSQLAYCRQLEGEERWSKAAKEYNALVRKWPNAPEAPLAQLRLAEILHDYDDDAEESFEEYKYLVDFYSLSCDYNEILDRMYRIADELREQGKTIIFWRFKNSVVVRRAYEACVLRAPGAVWAPEAMLKAGEMREEEGKDAAAITIYENLRNRYYGTPEARRAVAREAAVRMYLLERFGYNRDRCRDTIAFLQLARDLVEDEEIEKIEGDIVVAEKLLENEAYESARFYDSRTRPQRSAIAAYEKFLLEYPAGEHAEVVRQRLGELKGVVEQ